MGYFDQVKAEKTRPPIAVVPDPNNVVPIIRDDHDGIHPYAEAIRAAWLGRLDALPRPWVKGAAWDNNCFVTARKLVELANSRWAGYSHADARADYMAHAPYDGVWDKREKCWDQALDTAGATALPPPEPNAPIPDVTILAPDEGGAAVDYAEGPPLNPIIDWHELFASEGEDEEWIVEPLLPARRMVALYSAPKAGKSLLMLEIAVAIARGTEVIGTTIERPRRVLYVDFENDPRGDVLARLSAMAVTPDQLDGLCYLTYPSMAKFDTAQGAIDLIRHVQHYECEVVIIDTLSRSVAGEENANDTWLAFYRHTGLLLKQHGIACIRLDHSGKDAEKGMRGGSAKSGDVDAVWRLTAVSEDMVRLDCTDHRMPIPVSTLALQRHDFPLSHTPVGDDWRAVVDAKTRQVDQRLDALGVPSSASVREASEALRKAGEKAENRAIREAVKVRKLRLDMPTESPLDHIGERTVPAWEAGLSALSDGAWKPRQEVVQRMLEASDLAPVSCLNRIREAVTSGLLEQRGEHPDIEVKQVTRGVPGTPPAHRGTPEVSVPGTNPPLGVRPAHLSGRAETARHTPGIDDLDDDTLVGCGSCHRPTTAGAARRHGGLCATCFRDTGQEPTP